MHTRCICLYKTLLTTLFCLYAFSAFGDDNTFAPSKYNDELKAIRLPLIEIVTVTGEDPTGTNIFAPDDLWGIGLTDNDYVVGHYLPDRFCHRRRLFQRLGYNTRLYAGKRPYNTRLLYSIIGYYRCNL